MFKRLFTALVFECALALDLEGLPKVVRYQEVNFLCNDQLLKSSDMLFAVNILVTLYLALFGMTPKLQC